MTQALDCPGCNKRITIDDSIAENENIQLRSQVEQLKKDSLAIPRHMPSYQCPDGKCGIIHPNPKYEKRPKGKCSNCDQFSLEKEGTCPWCKERDSIEEVDKDDIEDLGIKLPG